MRIVLLALVGVIAATAVGTAAEPTAKALFGAVKAPARLAPASYGSYARGCLAGGVAMTWNGPYHQVMRLSRNRYWGHPALVDYLERFAVAAHKTGWPGLMIGDMGQPRGGPMVSGHASHQIGLDADIWLKPMPDHIMSEDEREHVSAVSMLNDGLTKIDRDHWTEAQARLIRAAARFPEVARIFVHPVIKGELCRWAGKDRAWLRKLRPWWGHYYHFHVRLSCPPDAEGCINQQPPPPGDGCGAELSSWFEAAKKPEKPLPPPKKKPELKLADLPAACRKVLNAP